MDLQTITSPEVSAASAALDGRVVTMPQFLATLCDQQGCSFLMAGEPVSTQVVMSPPMFLPLVGWVAQSAGQRLLGADFGCDLKRDEEGAFGVRCAVPHITGHIGDIVRSLFFAHYATEIFSLRQSALIEVHPIYEMFKGSFEAMLASPESSSEGGKIKWPQMYPAS